jgi:hypothetical protein
MAVEPYLWLGSVRTAAGSSDDFVSARGRFGAVVRGDERSTYRLCTKCGKVLYFPFGKKYVVWPIRTETPVFDLGFGFLVNAEVRDRLAGRRWNDVRFEEVDVVLQPRDGHPEFPSTFEA